MKPKNKRRRIKSLSDSDQDENTDGNKMEVDQATPSSKVIWLPYVSLIYWHVKISFKIALPKFEYKNSPNVSTNAPSTPKTKKEVQLDKSLAVIEKTELWMHEKLDWLKPDKIKDSAGRRSNHPDYDHRTLFVPDQFMKEQTPAMLAKINC